MNAIQRQQSRQPLNFNTGQTGDNPMSNEHTPTPWEKQYYSVRPDTIFIEDKQDGGEIGIVHTEVDADYVIRCVNSHNALVEALKHIRQALYEAMPYKRIQKGVSRNIMNTINKALKDAGE